MKTILLCASLVLLTGCAGQQPEGLRQLLASASCSKPDADQQLSLNLADEMLNGWAGCTRPIVKPHAWRWNNCAPALL